jgi:ubiquinone/menaquinone biosynthesis C-methylase UbiE
MSYKNNFHTLQKKYTDKYPNSLKMRSYLPDLSKKKILDIGCGSGLDMEFFKLLNAESISGTDISPELLSIAKQRVINADIRNDNFSYLSWKNETFDVVWSKYALQHAENIETPLKEMSRVCKKGGIILLQVTHPLRTFEFLPSKNYFDSGKEINYPMQDGSIIKEPHHTLSEWINNIIAAGFIIIKCDEIINKPAEEYNGLVSPSSFIFKLKKS